MSVFSRHLKKQIQLNWDRDLSEVAPSIQIGVLHKGKVKAKLHFGKPAQYFDLASLTKIIFGVSEVMALVEEGRLKLSDPVLKHWRSYRQPTVKVRDLLTHSAGYKAWSPYYRRLRYFRGFEARQLRLQEILLKEKRSGRRRSLYSDIDFFILGQVLESIHGMSLENIWRARSKNLGLRGIHFCPRNRPLKPRALYAPTEKCPWRKKMLRGEVHDDNCWALGGVSTHAGLFGSLNDVLKYAQLLRDGRLLKKASALGSQKTIRKFTKRATPEPLGDWAMGFMMPSRKDSSSGGHLSRSSVGHLGFTGTSLWFDPRKDLAVTILSNRVCPVRRNQLIREFRPLVHDLVVGCL